MGKKILVISDIHGNREALEAVEKFINKNKVDNIVCLGDTVGYGVDFEWCLRWLENHGAIVLQGNHESMLIGDTISSKCSNIARQSLIWTQERIKEEEIKKIKKMRYTHQESNILFTHAGTNEILKWRYIDSLPKAEESFLEHTNINFYGHTHRATLMKSCGDIIYLERGRSIELDNNQVYYINPGSVGQNRGQTTKASFIILELLQDKILIHYHNISYNCYRTYKKILEMGMDKEIADYLIREKWRKDLYSNNNKYS